MPTTSVTFPRSSSRRGAVGLPAVVVVSGVVVRVYGDSKDVTASVARMTCEVFDPVTVTQYCSN